MHEFNAGVQLMTECLKDTPNLDIQFVLNGWPKDESIFDGERLSFFSWMEADGMKSSEKTEKD